jgi:hypothetical protein
MCCRLCKSAHSAAGIRCAVSAGWLASSWCLEMCIFVFRPYRQSGHGRECWHHPGWLVGNQGVYDLANLDDGRSGKGRVVVGNYTNTCSARIYSSRLRPTGQVAE